MSTLKSDSIQPTTTGNNLIFRTGAGDVERMRIDTSGNVGIGTNSPDSKLHVVGSQIKFNTGTTAGLRLYEDSNTASFLRFRPLNASQRGFVFSNDGDAPHLTVSWDAASSTTTRVGIGTTTPTVALDVNGEVRSSTSTTSASNAKTLTTKDYVDSYFPVISTNLGIAVFTSSGTGFLNGWTVNGSLATAPSGTWIVCKILGNIVLTQDDYTRISAVSGTVSGGGTYNIAGGSDGGSALIIAIRIS